MKESVKASKILEYMLMGGNVFTLDNTQYRFFKKGETIEEDETSEVIAQETGIFGCFPMSGAKRGKTWLLCGYTLGFFMSLVASLSEMQYTEICANLSLLSSTKSKKNNRGET
jgi:hypothetical protein